MPVTLGGRKIAIRRPRVRTKSGLEVALETIGLFKQEDILNQTVLERMLHGLSTRDYPYGFEPCGREETAIGVSKSAVSRRFVLATRKALEKLLERPLDGLDILVLYIDGVVLGEHTITVALGLDGRGGEAHPGPGRRSHRNRDWGGISSRPCRKRGQGMGRQIAGFQHRTHWHDWRQMIPASQTAASDGGESTPKAEYRNSVLIFLRASTSLREDYRGFLRLYWAGEREAVKLHRLLALTMLLVNRDRVSAQELAEYFEVSPRTIYRDIETLCQAGIPVVSFQGARGGFGVMENYRLDRHVLSAGEMYAIVTALKGVGRTVGSGRARDLAEKIKALIPRQDLSHLDRDRKFLLDLQPWAQNPRLRRKLEVLDRAIDETMLVSFAYTNVKGESGRRLVEPMTLILKGHLWYLHGFCRKRQDFRLFKLSRMRDLAVTGEVFTRRWCDLDDYPLDRAWDTGEPPPPLLEITLRFAPRVRVRVEDQFDADEIEVAADGSLLIKAVYPEEEWVYGLILGFGEDVEVLGPERLRREIAARGRRIWEKHGGSQGKSE